LRNQFCWLVCLCEQKHTHLPSAGCQTLNPNIYPGNVRCSGACGVLCYIFKRNILIQHFCFSVPGYYDGRYAMNWLNLYLYQGLQSPRSYNLYTSLLRFCSKTREALAWVMTGMLLDPNTQQTTNFSAIRSASFFLPRKFRGAGHGSCILPSLL
jgi:hypothetical protein